MLLKIAPDLEWEAIEEILALVEEHKLAGIIATNTTIDHSSIAEARRQQGGLSGAPLRQRSTEIVRFIAERSKVPVIAVGGIMDADAALEKFDAGAALVQLYTGLHLRRAGAGRGDLPGAAGRQRDDEGEGESWTMGRMAGACRLLAQFRHPSSFRLHPFPMPATLEDALIDKVLAGERVTAEDARALYRLPLLELGELANRRRNLAKRDSLRRARRGDRDLHHRPEHQLHERLQRLLQVLRVLPDGKGRGSLRARRSSSSTRSSTS